MQQQKFEALVSKAIDELPEEFQRKLENVNIVVEDKPDMEQLRQLGLQHDNQLLGLYEGVPQTSRGGGYSMVLPDKITVFRKPIEAKCRSDREIEREIGEVIRHEVAHHFGISDRTLQRIESQRIRGRRKGVDL